MFVKECIEFIIPDLFSIKDIIINNASNALLVFFLSKWLFIYHKILKNNITNSIKSQPHQPPQLVSCCAQ